MPLYEKVGVLPLLRNEHDLRPVVKTWPSRAEDVGLIRSGATSYVP